MDLIIPTMWRIEGFTSTLESYVASPNVDRIIIIDNDPSLNVQVDLPKVETVSFGKNIFVNPAWNEGYRRSSADLIGILNDDICVGGEVLEKISNLDFTEIDLLGFNINPTETTFSLERVNVDKTVPVGVQFYAFGVCFFLPRVNYKEIPDLYQIWFGDDYICHCNEKVFRFSSNQVTGQISGTINKERANPVIQERIRLDTENAHRYLIQSHG